MAVIPADCWQIFIFAASTWAERQVKKQLSIFSLEAPLLLTVAVRNITKYQSRGGGRRRRDNRVEMRNCNEQQWGWGIEAHLSLGGWPRGGPSGCPVPLLKDKYVGSDFSVSLSFLQPSAVTRNSGSFRCERTALSSCFVLSDLPPNTTWCCVQPAQ